MIRVLIVDDSPVVREFLTYILTSDPAIQVVGVAKNGAEALEAVGQLRPDVITMDLHMPIMDGFEATRRIMETRPTPIVIVSASTGAKEVAGTFRAMEAGALVVVSLPPDMNQGGVEAGSKELSQAVKLMSEVKLVRRISAATQGRVPNRPSLAPSPMRPPEIQVAAIGASTGGPPALRRILSGLPQDLPFPLLIVQHVAPGFVRGLGEWLAGASGFPVRIASQDERPLPGQAYLAPEDFHMGLGTGSRIVLSDQAPENGLRPSVAHLFRSLAQGLGPTAVGVLLTGMGVDGAQELKAMRDKGAITIAQDKGSSVVNGMPGEAVRLEAATYVLTPEGIAGFLAALAIKVKRGYP